MVHARISNKTAEPSTPTQIAEARTRNLSKKPAWKMHRRTPSNVLPPCIRRIFYVGVLFMSSTIEFSHAKIGYFWHITDLHLNSFYSTKGDVNNKCWHRNHHQSSGRTPGRYGDYFCDSPWSLLESATMAMKSRQGDNVEFVLWTGDGLSHSTLQEVPSESHRLDILRNITELLGRTFPSQFVFPVLGHEEGANNNFQRLGELWRQWLPSEALQTFAKGGYYTIEQKKSRLRIVALNTNFMRHDSTFLQGPSAAVRQRTPANAAAAGSASSGSMDSTEYTSFHYHHNNGHHSHGEQHTGHGGHVGSSRHRTENGARASVSSEYNDHDSEGQWDWLEDVLAKSSIKKETVYIVGHIPPGSDERLSGNQQNGHKTFSEEHNARYLRLVRKYSSIIQGQFYGHLHSDSFRIIYNDTGKPVSWIMISPSVTPRKLSVGSNNPAMRLYKFDTDSGQVLDYTQYYLDLKTANNEGEANWQPEYNLTTYYYGLSEITPLTLHNLADRFTNTENPLFIKYHRANSVRHQTQICEGVCALNHYCAITRVDYLEYRQCLQTAASALASSSQPLIIYTPTVILTLTSMLMSLDALFKIYLMAVFHCIFSARQLATTFLQVLRLAMANNRKNATTKDIQNHYLFKQLQANDIFFSWYYICRFSCVSINFLLSSTISQLQKLSANTRKRRLRYFLPRKETLNIHFEEDFYVQKKGHCFWTDNEMIEGKCQHRTLQCQITYYVEFLARIFRKALCNCSANYVRVLAVLHCHFYTLESINTELKNG